MNTLQDIFVVVSFVGMALAWVLVGYELLKRMIVDPIKWYYWNTTFADGSSYEHDVLSRHRNEFEACLLYLRDYMEAIDSEDVLTIQALRKNRNDLAHKLITVLPALDIHEHQPLFKNVDRTLFKLSRHHAFIEIGGDPAYQSLFDDWESVKGHEYLLWEAVVEKVKLLDLKPNG